MITCYDSYYRQFKMTENGKVLKGTDTKWANRFGQHEREKAGEVLKNVFLNETH